MSGRWMFRIAAIVLVLFAVGHTVGFLTFRAATEEGRAVWQSMQAVHFSVGSSTFSYGGFYVGFGLCITLFYLFAAFVAWRLSAANSDAARQLMQPLGWALVTLQCAGAMLSWVYFGVAPLVLSLAAAGLIGAGLVLEQRRTGPGH